MPLLRTYHEWGAFQRFPLKCEVGTLWHLEAGAERSLPWASWLSPGQVEIEGTGEHRCGRNLPALLAKEDGKRTSFPNSSQTFQMWRGHGFFLNPVALQELSHPDPWSLFLNPNLFLRHFYLKFILPWTNVCVNYKTVYSLLLLKASHSNQSSTQALEIAAHSG